MQLIYLFIFTRLWKVLFNWYERFGGFKNENKLDLKKNCITINVQTFLFESRSCFA